MQVPRGQITLCAGMFSQLNTTRRSRGMCLEGCVLSSQRTEKQATTHMGVHAQGPGVHFNIELYMY